MAKEGSTVSGLMDTIAKMTSLALQYGVPLEKLVDQFSHTRFEPSGFTNNREIPIAKSVTDYVFRYLGNRYLQIESETENTDAEGEAVGLEPVVQRPKARGSRRIGDSGCAAINARSELCKSGRCTVLYGLWLDHGEKWGLLQVPQLWGDERL